MATAYVDKVLGSYIYGIGQSSSFDLVFGVDLGTNPNLNNDCYQEGINIVVGLSNLKKMNILS